MAYLKSWRYAISSRRLLSIYSTHTHTATRRQAARLASRASRSCSCLAPRCQPCDPCTLALAPAVRGSGTRRPSMHMCHAIR